MIRIENLSKFFPSGDLFLNVSFYFKKGMRVGLVGPNGSGKTTLLKIMLGKESIDSGSVLIEKSVTIGYLAQEIVSGSKHSILEEVLSNFPEIRQLEGKMISLSHEIANDPQNLSLMSKLGDVQDRFEALDGWTLEKKAKKILSGLGFTEEQFTEDMHVFSGGWRMRVALASILLQNPDILFLDEPTNHLDLEATIWLESFLSNWKGGMVIISHDRTFLDRSVNHILEIDLKKITLYHGNYSEYKINKTLRMEQHHAAYLNQQKQIKDTKRFIERFRYKNTKATQVQSRIKMLAKMEKIEFLSEQNHAMNLILPQPSRPPQNIAICRNVNKNYGDLKVFNKLNLTVERGQKIGLVGHNGAGKSTLLKMLAGVEEVTDGAVRIGANVERAYYAQHQLEILDPDDTVFESIRKSNEEWSENEIRSYLGSFLFSGDEIEKRIKILSGGEKARVSLAKMLIKPAHLLLLDEPTNHLDIISRNLVEKSLIQFTGSIVCISHDRHFLNNVTNLICEVGGGNIRMFEGNYDYYAWKKLNESSKENTGETKPKLPSKNKLNYQERKKYNNRLAWIKKRFNIIENEIDKEKSTIQNPKYVDNYEILQKAMGNLTAFEDEYIKLMEEQDKIKANGI